MRVVSLSSRKEIFPFHFSVHTSFPSAFVFPAVSSEPRVHPPLLRQGGGLGGWRAPRRRHLLLRCHITESSKTNQSDLVRVRSAAHQGAVLLLAALTGRRAGACPGATGPRAETQHMHNACCVFLSAPCVDGRAGANTHRDQTVNTERLTVSPQQADTHTAGRHTTSRAETS